MKHIIRSFLIFSFLMYANLFSISMVYNFRIAQATKQPIFDEEKNSAISLIGLWFDQYVKKRAGGHQNFLGGLGSFIYDFNSYYFRTDFAASYIWEKHADQTKFSSAETDDLLFTFGHNFIANKSNVITLSGFLGIPTHKVFRLMHADFGYSQVGMGLQIDGSAKLNRISSFLYGTRYIYFIQRNAADNLGKRYTFSIGNIFDILVASKNSWKHHGIEFGYTSRFQFGSKISPHLADITKKINYIRSNFYAIYKYKFLINKIQNRFLFNISYGFDQKPKHFGDKYVITFWTSWNIKF